MISAIHYNDDSTASRILELVARNAPRFMRCGGGPLSGEDLNQKRVSGSGTRISEDMRERILAEGREGKLSPTEIARKLGTTQSTVRGLLNRMDVPLVSGRGRR